MSSTGERVAVTEFLNRDLNTVGMWCDLWGMKLTASKTKTMIISRSRTINPQSTTLTLDGTILKEHSDINICDLWLGGFRIQPTFALVRVVRGD